MFRALENHALNATDPLSVAGRAQVAIDAAVRRHPGLLVGTRLERRLHELGREHVTAVSPHPSRRSGIERVLHVLTEAYDTGGHTRVAERWILADRKRRSTVLLTGQGALPVPATLQAAARASGGGVVGLPGGDLLMRAWNLRALAAEHDAVVLHAHMHDVVPALALADPDGRPPTILFNHASHQFWVGVGIADVIANFRAIDDRITWQRRGAERASSVVLPIPVTPSDLPSRAEARAALGITATTRLILAVGSAYKVGPVLEPAFTDLVAEILRASPHAEFIAVGPCGAGPHADPVWVGLGRASHGRARAIGVQSGAVVGQLLAAADVLLDTWPVTGGTTLLDAAYAGLPVVSLGDGRPDLGVTRPTSMTLGGAVIQAPSAELVAGHVAELLADEPRRSALAARARAHVDTVHAAGWDTHMEAVFEAARERCGSAAPPGDDPPPQASDWECTLQLLHEAAGSALAPEHVLLLRAADLPADERPSDLSDARSRVGAIVAAFGESEPTRRAVAAPLLQPAAIASLLAEVRALVSAGEVDSCTVAVAASSLAEAVSLFEAEMAAGGDVDIEIVLGDDIESITRPGDRLLGSHSQREVGARDR